MAQIGVISDTHGLLRPEALEALAGSDIILHAGDVGSPQILADLARIAPVRAVRGNVDRDTWASQLPWTDLVEFAGEYLYVLHDLSALDLDPVAAGIRAVISGHSHRPLVEERRGVYFINPGSAGPRRFDLPISVARIWINSGKFEPEIVDFHI